MPTKLAEYAAVENLFALAGDKYRYLLYTSKIVS